MVEVEVSMVEAEVVFMEARSVAAVFAEVLLVGEAASAVARRAVTAAGAATAWLRAALAAMAGGAPTVWEARAARPADVPAQCLLPPRDLAQRGVARAAPVRQPPIRTLP
jgi:hypothetical protein